MIGALKEKLKVEKSYAAGLRVVGGVARPKGTKSFLPMDELLGDQVEVTRVCDSGQGPASATRGP